jgi:hypothetical protein
MEGRLSHDARDQARIMIASVRKHMPVARIVQHSDMEYPQTDGVDEIRRRRFDGDHIQRRWSHMQDMMRYGRENVLSLDCDVVVKRDVIDVFEQDFDIAMCRTLDRRDLVFNAGVIFAKPSGAGFWAEVLYEYAADPAIMDEWEGSQTALTRAADKSALKVRNLNFDIYNFTPNGPGVVPPTAQIVHYRGRRKRFMAQDNLEHAHG